MSSFHHLPENHQFANDEKSFSALEVTQLTDENGVSLDTNFYGNSFESFCFTSNDQILVASSNLYGRYLHGYITRYSSLKDVPKKPNLYINPEAGGCSNLLQIKENYLAAFDSGHIISFTNDLQQISSQLQHEEPITQVNCNRDRNKFVSGCFGGSIILWDYDSFTPLKILNDAHSGVVWTADFNHLDENMLLSVGQDKLVIVWDIRTPKPASLLSSLDVEPTSLVWSQKDISLATVGTSDGRLLLFDIRKPRNEIHNISACSKRIYRLRNVLGGAAIAVCQNNEGFYVFHSETFDLIYKDTSSHKGWVRDVLETGRTLYTIARDSQIVHHSQEFFKV